MPPASPAAFSQRNIDIEHTLSTSGRRVRAPNEMLYVSAAAGHFWTEDASFTKHHFDACAADV